MVEAQSRSDTAWVAKRSTLRSTPVYRCCVFDFSRAPSFTSLRNAFTRSVLKRQDTVWARQCASTNNEEVMGEIYPTIAQCTVVAAALKVLLWPA